MNGTLSVHIINDKAIFTADFLLPLLFYFTSAFFNHS